MWYVLMCIETELSVMSCVSEFIDPSENHDILLLKASWWSCNPVGCEYRKHARVRFQWSVSKTPSHAKCSPKQSYHSAKTIYKQLFIQLKKTGGYSLCLQKFEWHCSAFVQHVEMKKSRLKSLSHSLCVFNDYCPLKKKIIFFLVNKWDIYLVCVMYLEI